ncbi:hypothetical protein Pyrde_0455 [Pyrodictium delaneyi]|nr:lipoate protein ligase C-terminal domain-containing protein [Pyrodictium delaneyi]ALL00505.1 hypothetical protein Pyrde_0455 [Pyrodictium delaneyi]
MKTIERILRIPGGKTLELSITVDKECKIIRVTISGDFFIYPSEALEQLESMLKGCNNIVCIEERIRSIAESTEALGFTWGQLTSSLIELYHELCRL